MNEGTVLLTAQTGRKVTLPLCLIAAGPVWLLPKYRTFANRLHNGAGPCVQPGSPKARLHLHKQMSHGRVRNARCFRNSLCLLALANVCLLLVLIQENICLWL